VAHVDDRSLAVGVAWFLWVLLTLSAIATLLWAAAPRVIEALGQRIDAMRDRPMTAFVAFLMFSILVYLPMHLIFGDSSWLEPATIRFRFRPAVSCSTPDIFLSGSVSVRRA